MKCFIAALLIFVQTSFVHAQDEDLDALVNDTKSDLLMVVGAGLAGAILGLSTLSFVDEPKEHTQNIIMGASLGIIVGVGYVAFSQANKSKEMIYPAQMEDEYVSMPMMGTRDRVAWHYAEHLQNKVPTNKINALQYNLTF